VTATNDRQQTTTDIPPAVKRQKMSHIGAPAIFALELECKTLNRAFGGHGCYVVGSSLERSDWRDVDVRFILPDDEFQKLFPKVDLKNPAGTWEFDDRWLVMTTAISERLSRITGLPVDFQFQPRTHANRQHNGRRDAIGISFVVADEING
jgi:hypothetical protein